MKQKILFIAAIMAIAVGCEEKYNDVTPPVIDYADIVVPTPHSFSVSELTVTGDADPYTTKVSDFILLKHSRNCLQTLLAIKVDFPSETSNKYKMVSLDSIVLVKEGNNLKIEQIIQTVESISTDPDKGVLTLNGVFEGKKLTLRMNIKSAKYEVDYNVVMVGKSTAAELVKYKITHPSFVAEPELLVDAKKKNFIICYVADNALDTPIKVVPVFEVSEHATMQVNKVNYIAGQEIEINSSGTELKVIAENGQNYTNYTILLNSKNKTPFASNLDLWVTRNKNSTGADAYKQFDEPIDGWATTNGGLLTIKTIFANLYDKTAPYLVTKIANKEGYAAQLVTVDTKGNTLGIPKITSGSLYNGIFELNMSSPLKSTKFGTICTQVPVSFKGEYKYKAGNVYYYCPDVTKRHLTVVDNTKVDLPAINAVLYEVIKEDELLDGTNLLTSDKIVARASVTDVANQNSFVAFDVKFVFESGKTFDAAKKYKLAIVCSSSKEGDKFSGAPGSTLVVDDLAVIF